MIRLIASDLDGTLLRTDKSLPESFGETFDELRERGVVFVAASGRQYANIYNALYPRSEDCHIISDNGSVNGHGREITETFMMPPEAVTAVLEGLERIRGAHPLVCTADCGYYTDDDPDFVRELHRYYVKTKNVAEGASQLTALRVRAEKEDVIGKCASKIAVYVAGKAEEMIDEMPDVPGLKHVVSGADWIDFARVDVNKGRALRALRERLGIGREECVAFGDQFNDREMLEECGSAFVTANASLGMRELFPAVLSNDEEGVIRKIRELLGLPERSRR